MRRRGGDWMLKICCVSHDSCAGVIQTTVPVVLFDTVDVKDDLMLFSDLFGHRQFCFFVKVAARSDGARLLHP